METKKNIEPEQDYDHMARILDFMYEMAMNRKKANANEIKTILLLRQKVLEQKTKQNS